jgi:hypothetical protein
MACGCLKERAYGKCHICGDPDVAITFCSRCEHWFCCWCESNWPRRAVAAIVQFFGGRRPNCCGPTGVA